MIRYFRKSSAIDRFGFRFERASLARCSGSTGMELLMSRAFKGRE